MHFNPFFSFGEGIALFNLTDEVLEASQKRAKNQLVLISRQRITKVIPRFPLLRSRC